MIILNKKQLYASKFIENFINSENDFMILLGPGGSGKTTVVSDSLKNLNKSVCFCAFTNKATKVLSDKSNKIRCLDSKTIHKLLKLEPEIVEYKIKTKGKNNVIKTALNYKYSLQKQKYLVKYDIIVFDECSTITNTLFDQIMSTYNFLLNKKNHTLKYIFLGDFWQLPPVNENSSIVFKTAIKNKWPLIKLNKVMRSGNKRMETINDNLLDCIKQIKENPKNIRNIFENFPHNIIKNVKNKVYINDYSRFINKYFKLIKKRPNTVFITYSNKNCDNINKIIQEMRLSKNKQTSVNFDITNKYKENDRIMINNMVYKSEWVKKNETIEMYRPNINDNNEEYLYNGEIYIVRKVQKIKVISNLNITNLKSIPEYFNAELLTLESLSNNNLVKTVYINDKELEECKRILRCNLKKSEYKNQISQFRKIFPILKYGYCMTIYKAQGSEFDCVLLNLASFYWSFKSKKQIASTKSEKSNKGWRKLLFKAIYSAATRAKRKLYVYSSS